jgi:hypothetical protein
MSKFSFLPRGVQAGSGRSLNAEVKPVVYFSVTAGKIVLNNLTLAAIGANVGTKAIIGINEDAENINEKLIIAITDGGSVLAAVKSNGKIRNGALLNHANGWINGLLINTVSKVELPNYAELEKEGILQKNASGKWVGAYTVTYEVGDKVEDDEVTAYYLINPKKGVAKLRAASTEVEDDDDDVADLDGAFGEDDREPVLS